MIADAARELKAAWAKARRDWDDETARRFEAEFLEPLAPKLSATIEAMDRIAATSARAERECS
jgi:hypothetical protein